MWAAEHDASYARTTDSRQLKALANRCGHLKVSAPTDEVSKEADR